MQVLQELEAAHEGRLAAAERRGAQLAARLEAAQGELAEGAAAHERELCRLR